MRSGGHSGNWIDEVVSNNVIDGLESKDRDPAPRAPVMGQVHKPQRDGLAKGAKPGDQNVQDLARPNRAKKSGRTKLYT